MTTSQNTICHVPVRNELASKSRVSMSPCGKPAKLRVKWPLRRIGNRVELSEVGVCGAHAAANATTKFMENVPSECYTNDEVKLLAGHGMYVAGRTAHTLVGRVKTAIKKLRMAQ